VPGDSSTTQQRQTKWKGLFGAPSARLHYVDAMIPEKQVAWLAGIFDGEGCVVRQIHINKPIIGLSINMTSEEAIRTVSRLFRRLGATANVYSLNVRSEHKPRWSVEVRNTEHVIAIAIALLPHSVVKKNELQVVIKAGKVMLRARLLTKGSKQRQALSDKAAHILTTGIPPRQKARARSCVR
jgi:hypothetical protein